MSRKPCNVALGRFQPFTKGHLQMLKDGYDKNGYPAVVFMISNKKFDSKHPFSDELIAKEMEGAGTLKSKPGIKLCPGCGLPMQKRNGRFGEFWGCTGFPDCRCTENI